MRRPRLTYANVVSTVALFVALGGTSYAATKLPRSSVGAAQIRAGAVRSSEIAYGAVHMADLAGTTAQSLRGPSGPPGPLGPAGTPGTPAAGFFATVSGAGQLVRGNATSSAHAAVGSGAYIVSFARDVSGCAYTATLGGIDPSDQPPGHATVRNDGGKVGVQLYDAAGSPVDRSFHLIVVC
jgi:hypothetical protein